MRRRVGRPTYRETLIRNKAALDFYADMAQKPRIPSVLLDKLPPKRVIRRPVDNRPVGPSEHQEQSAVVSWWNLACAQYYLPAFALFAVPNGGARDAITGSRLKAEGVRPGALDLVLAKPNGEFAGLFIEMKVGTNKPSDRQDAFIKYLTDAGYRACVHWSATSAIAEIKQYLGSTPFDKVAA